MDMVKESVLSLAHSTCMLKTFVPDACQVRDDNYTCKYKRGVEAINVYFRRFS